MRRIGTWTAAAVLGAGLLVGCGGGGDTEAYCDGMKEAESDFSGDSANAENFQEMADRFQDLADEAPDEVADDWDKLLEALNGFTDTLDDAGVSVEDLSDPEKAQDIDPETLQELSEASEAMGAEEYTEASDNITEHANEECGLDLS